MLTVSIPNGKPILFRQQNINGTNAPTGTFQSQTGSPSSSDVCLSCKFARPLTGFNPKREAHPLQTATPRRGRLRFPARFQSQTGSPSSSDKAVKHGGDLLEVEVSIPNGKPILFRRCS